MREMRLPVFAGTADGRCLAEALDRQGVKVLLCVATDYGADLADRALPGVPLREGRMKAEEMERLFSDHGCPAAIDATHPYAREVSHNIHAACEAAGIEYLRLSRPAWDGDGLVDRSDSAAEAARFLADQRGEALLTVGSKELEAFAGLPGLLPRLTVRVLPSADALQKCTALGFAGSRIIAMQGPFSHEMNVATIRQTRADWLVTKDSGETGGFYEKLSAVRETGIRMLLIRRPREEEGLSAREIEHRVLELLGIPDGAYAPSAVYPRLPLFVELAGKPAVVVGGGAVALRRVRTLLRCGAVVTVIAPVAGRELADMAGQETIRLLERAYRPGDLAGMTLAVAATDDARVNARVAEEARSLGVPISVADNPDGGSFWFPAFVHGSGLVAGVVSAGAQHRDVAAMAEKIRMQLGGGL